ncbi:MAG: hypothetical protein A3K66_05420 [Euryarchaeota archaeon RBG_16_67_27]|nr:MAG: hypothetical protein A3K66_05420 [Euryarchaeota archaeon RBG_16_67_27]
MAVPTWIVAVLAASSLAVGGAAAAGFPVADLLGGADASDHPSHETNGVPPGPPIWLGDAAPYGPPSWLNETEPLGPPSWLVPPNATAP